MMNKRNKQMKPYCLLLGLLMAWLVLPSHAEVLTINTFQPEVRPGDHLFVNGLSQQAVLDRFGEPKERLAGVGHPPISRWVYDEFTVYFEFQTALHAVVHRHRKQPQ